MGAKNYDDALTSPSEISSLNHCFWYQWY